MRAASRVCAALTAVSAAALLIIRYFLFLRADTISVSLSNGLGVAVWCCAGVLCASAATWIITEKKLRNRSSEDTDIPENREPSEEDGGCGAD